MTGWPILEPKSKKVALPNMATCELRLHVVQSTPLHPSTRRAPAASQLTQSLQKMNRTSGYLSNGVWSVNVHSFNIFIRSTFLNCASLLCNIWYYPQRLLIGSYWESTWHILYCMPMSSMALVPEICHLVAEVKSSLVSIWYLTKIICLLQKPNKQTNKQS